MRKLLSVLKVLLVVAIIPILLVSTVGSKAPPEKVLVIIGFKDKPDPALVKEHGGDIKREYTLINAIAANLPENMVERLKKSPKVEYVEPDAIAHTLLETTPWGITKINATQVWQTPYNNKGTGVKVAILDTGIQYDHPDLKTNIKGGVNYVGLFDGSTSYLRWTDKNGHGTHVAGIVAAVDNDIGVIGVAPEARLYAVKVLSDQGWGYYSDVIQGIQWATNNGMQIISMSLGGTSYSQAMKDAVDKAKANGIVVVAAAGNSGDGNPLTNNILYPAKYDSVIAVGATDSNDAVASWSSDGGELDVSAPGVSILSTYKGSTYATMSGTSMATPHVSGTVALMLKAGILPSDVQGKLQTTAVDISLPGTDVYSGYGRIDALGATAIS